MDPGCFTVFRRNYGGDTDPLPLNDDPEETIQHGNDGLRDEIDTYDQWEHDNDYDY
jgi:hypothetical protein